MKKREFNKVIKSICSGESIDRAKASQLDGETKDKLVKYLVKNRVAIITEFLGHTCESWLACCGYSYRFSHKGFNFLGTGENKIRILGFSGIV